MRIGQRIKERRKELGMSADTLGEKLGKNRATIYRYENGEIENLPLDILDPIAKALQTTPQYLMGWEKAIEKDPVKTAELHFEMIDMLSNEDLREIFEDFKKLTPEAKQMAKKIIRSMANEEV